MTATRSDPAQTLEAVEDQVQPERELAAVIERTYAFDEIRDALAHVETGHARGKVVVGIGEARSRRSRRRQTYEH